MENELNKSYILVIDDNILNREILSDVLSPNYQILLAEDGEAGIKQLQEHHSDILIVLLDLVMPKMDGFEVLRAIKANHWSNTFPIVMISSDVNEQNIKKAYEMGVQDFIARPFVEAAVREKVSSVIKSFAKQQYMIETIRESMAQTQRYSKMMVEILSHMVEYRNGESGMHVKRVGIITKFLLEKLKTKTDKYELTDDDIELISLASSFHDIGKIGIPGEILNKPGRLTDEEFATMKTHSQIGFEMLDSITIYKDEKLVKYSKDIAHYHHERWNGRGYPTGISGDDIPICAQVVGVADCYDALTSQRCYKPPYSPDESIKMITNDECGVFQPLLYECLKECADDLKTKLTPDALAQPQEEEIKDKINKFLSLKM